MVLYRKFIAACLLAMTLATAGPAAAALQASVDRREILPGETITLTLRQDDPAAAQAPDLRGLEENFQVLDVRRSQHVTIVNGDRTESMDWVVVLLPNNASVDMIPAIRAGTQMTQPIRIATVVPSGEQAQNRPALFVEAELEESEGFVGSEVLYTVRVYDQGKMQSGTLRPPEIPGARIETSGESSNRQVILDGARYSLHEQRFRITPEQSGTLEISPAILEARMQPSPQDNRRRTRGFFSDFFDRVGQAGPLKRIASNPLTLEVRSRPGEAQGWFLPAKVVRLDEVWSAESGELRFGEALTRTVSLRVLGATSEQLPAFVIPGPKGARQYAEGTREGTRPTDNGTISVREESVTIIPEGPGTLEFPPVEVKWFDVDAEQTRIARLPGKTFEILPAPGQTRTEAPVAPAPPAIPATPLTEREPHSPPPPEQPEWSGMIGVFIAVILSVLVGAAVWMRRRPQHPTQPAPRVRAREVLSACRESDPRKARQAFLHWAQAAIAQPCPPNLIAIGEHLEDEALTSALRDLDQCLYGRSPETWSGKKLRAAFGPYSRKRMKEIHAGSAPLPSLYPSG